MKLNIYKQIALYVGVLILIICIGLGITAYKFSSNATIQDAEDNLQLLSAEGVSLMEAIISGRINLLENIAERTDIKTLDWEKQQPMLERQLERLKDQGYLNFGVVSSDGHVRLLDGSEAEVGDRDYVRKAFQGTSNISDLIVNRVTNTLDLMYAVPIFDENNRLAQVLIASVPGDTICGVTDQIGYGQEGYSFVFGSDGTIIAHPNRNYIMEQRNVAAEIKNNTELKDWALAIQEVGVGNAGVTKYKLNNKDMYIGLEVFPSSGWTLGVVAQETELLDSLVTMRNVIVIASLVFLALGIGVAMFIGRLISEPINAGTAFAGLMAAGDFTQTIPEKHYKRHDEIGDLAKAFTALVANLRSMIGEINTSSQELAAASEEMSAVAQNSSANMEEVSASTEEISAGLEEVSAAAEEISASGEEMNAVTVQLVNSSRQGYQVAKEIEEKAKKIRESVTDSQQKALNIYVELDKKLKESIAGAQVVNEISNMANQIAGIAEQTNLLALNAAIEAARAGEQGRGFAVVAEEVRKLANEARETVQSIQGLTVQVQENIKTLIKDSNRILEFMSKDINNDYQKFLEVAEEYMRDAHSFFDLSAQDIQMGEEVLGAVNEVASSINEVTQTIGQSAEGAGQIARGTDETAKSMIEINEASGKLAKMSEALISSMSQFKF